MSVNVEFGPDNRHGIVAEGTYLWDAAKRLGLHLPAECEGRGECDGCAVIIKEGAPLLSELTNAERERLNSERLAGGERLACQVKVERPGNLRLEPVPVEEREETVEETKSELREEFRNLPLQKKLTTLVELEAIAAYQTFKAISDLSSSVFEKGIDVIANFGRAREQRARQSHRPAEHRAENQEGKHA